MYAMSSLRLLGYTRYLLIKLYVAALLCSRARPYLLEYMGPRCFAADFIYFRLRSAAADSYAESVYVG